MSERRNSDPYAPAREAAGDRAEPEQPQQPRRSYVTPLAIALAVFVVVLVVRMFWGGLDN